jgi:hypothetical protein
MLGEKINEEEDKSLTPKNLTIAGCVKRRAKSNKREE